MGRISKDVRYIKRGKVYYYKLKGHANFKTTNQTSKTAAENYVNNIILKQGFQNASTMLFCQYAEQFFDWDRCPHIKRLLEEGKSITKRYASIQHGSLKKFILPSNLSLLKLNEVKRSHIIDFRTSLTKLNLAPGTINKIMSVLKVIFHEACYREDLPYNPTLDVGIVKESRKERGVLTTAELKLLFPLDYLTVWSNEIDYTCFFIAASTGMRRGEVLALRWKHVNFDKNEIRVEESWKDLDEIGLPKWDKPRTLFIPETLKQRLLAYKANRITNMPDDLIIANIDGTRLKDTWWKKHFEKALEKSGIDYKGRNLTPHSLRHTLNSIMLASGENPDKIRSTFGWNSQKIQDNYTHWDSQNFKSQGSIVDSIWKDEEA